jgi:uncharacterized membrane-anchored protein YjiN (DUF445 family)
LEQTKVRRPSNLERYWLRNILLTCIGAYSCRFLYIKYNDGSLQIAVQKCSDLVSAKLQEHVIEPVNKLFAELFDTIRHRDLIVSRRDYERSKEALHRMLEDFSQSKEGVELISKLKTQIMENSIVKDQIMNNRLFQKSGSATATEVDGTPPPPPPPPPVTPPLVHQVPTPVNPYLKEDPEVVVTLEPDAEKALEALMREYEKDLKSPIRGIVTGNLLTAILIQVCCLYNRFYLLC